MFKARDGQYYVENETGSKFMSGDGGWSGISTRYESLSVGGKDMYGNFNALADAISTAISRLSPALSATIPTTFGPHPVVFWNDDVVVTQAPKADWEGRRYNIQSRRRNLRLFARDRVWGKPDMPSLVHFTLCGVFSALSNLPPIPEPTKQEAAEEWATKMRGCGFYGSWSRFLKKGDLKLTSAGPEFMSGGIRIGDDYTLNGRVLGSVGGIIDKIALTFKNLRTGATFTDTFEVKSYDNVSIERGPVTA